MEPTMEFIDRFRGSTEHVFSGACSYWFAMILFRRFLRDGAELMVDTDASHFGTRIKKRVYDVTGDVTGSYRWIPWNECTDPALRGRLTREQILL